MAAGRRQRELQQRRREPADDLEVVPAGQPQLQGQAEHQRVAGGGVGHPHAGHVAEVGLLVQRRQPAPETLLDAEPVTPVEMLLRGLLDPSRPLAQTRGRHGRGRLAVGGEQRCDPLLDCVEPLGQMRARKRPLADATAVSAQREAAPEVPQPVEQQLLGHRRCLAAGVALDQLVEERRRPSPTHQHVLVAGGRGDPGAWASSARPRRARPTVGLRRPAATRPHRRAVPDPQLPSELPGVPAVADGYGFRPHEVLAAVQPGITLPHRACLQYPRRSVGAAADARRPDPGRCPAP